MTKLRIINFPFQPSPKKMKMKLKVKYDQKRNVLVDEYGHALWPDLVLKLLKRSILELKLQYENDCIYRLKVDQLPMNNPKFLREMDRFRQMFIDMAIEASVILDHMGTVTLQNNDSLSND